MPDEAVAPDVSVEVLPVPDMVPLLELLEPEPIVPLLVVPVLLVLVSVDDGVLLVLVSVDDGVLPIVPLRVSSVLVVDDDPVVLPLLCVPVLLLPELP